MFVDALNVYSHNLLLNIELPPVQCVWEGRGGEESGELLYFCTMVLVTNSGYLTRSSVSNTLLTPDINTLLTPDINTLLTPDINTLLTPNVNTLLNVNINTPPTTPDVNSYTPEYKYPGC